MHASALRGVMPRRGARNATRRLARGHDFRAESVTRRDFLARECSLSCPATLEPARERKQGLEVRGFNERDASHARSLLHWPVMAAGQASRPVPAVDQKASLEIASPPPRVAKARQGMGLMVDFKNRTEPSANRKFAPPGCRLQ